MGRPRGDSAIQRAKGNSKKPDRQYDRGDMAAPPGTPDRPDDIVGRPQEIWNDLIFKLSQIPELLTIVDGHVIADLCHCISQKEDVHRALKLECAEVTKAAKAAGNNPLIAKGKVVGEYQKDLDRLRARQGILMNELGMSPRSRSQIKVRAPGFVRQSGTVTAGAGNQVSDPVLFGGSGGLMKM